MYHYMQIDPSLIRERNERMRAEMSKLRLEKRLREHHEGSGLRPLAYFLRLTSALRPLRGAVARPEVGRAPAQKREVLKRGLPMSGYVGVSAQVDKDFHRALLKASLRRWIARLRGDTHDERLLSFEEAQSGWVCSSQAYRGMRTVDVERIIGSVGRYKDFDRSFLPRKMSMAERWSRVDSAYHQGVELPAVSLYKMGEEYYVVDGNHRVSVARYHEVVTIDAEVVEIRCVVGWRQRELCER